MKNTIRIHSLSFLAVLALSACSGQGSKATQPAIVHDPLVTDLGTGPSIAPGVSTAQKVRVVMTVDKAAILNQEFLYGTDLQYSNIKDPGMDLYNQSLALGHIPARFRIQEGDLVLVSDNKYAFPGDLNHPEKLLSRFKILKETDKTLVISGFNSQSYLGQLLGQLKSSNQADIQELWARSFEFDPNGNYLLQETSVMLKDASFDKDGTFKEATIGEFMESIFPRASMAVSPNFEIFPMIPGDPVGAADGVAARYRFLPTDPIYQAGEKVSFAEHYDLPDAGTIDWYVTPNIPEEFLKPVSQAVEGWNRYFEKMDGIARKVMVFKGRLPEGKHLGDPRYNVINWDSVRKAGAAYESQAFDPITGKQSHSLIYLPAAWIQIGLDYWKNGLASDPLPEKAPRFARSLHVTCSRDMNEAAELMASGRLFAGTERSAKSVDESLQDFAVELLKGTLFHEVGHALGLNHNFKGSLALDRSNPKSLFSTSIMDYNDFEVERGAFHGVDTADGPLLEYDRQILSALYNKSKNVREDDAVVPACNDAEADNEDGGVDPLCIRYDLEKDPTLSVNTAFERIVQPTLPGDMTLAQALRNTPALILDTAAVAKIKTADELAEMSAKVAGSLKGTMTFYILTGRASLTRTVRTNVKSLLTFADGVLPDGYDAKLMRERAYTGVQRALGFNTLNAAVKLALDETQQAALSLLAKSPYLSSLPADQAKQVLDKTAAKISKSVQAFETSASGLPKLRTTVLSYLNRHKAVPYFLGKNDQAVLDYEAQIVQLLADAVPADGGRTAAERQAAATSLATYAKRLQGDAAIARVLNKLELERGQAASNESRELVETLLATLKQ